MRQWMPQARHYLPECTKDHSSYNPPRRECHTAMGVQDFYTAIRGLLRDEVLELW
jgi:hypothetical protein